MLQSIDSYLDEEQGNARLISEQRCQNIFLGTNSHDVRSHFIIPEKVIKIV